MRRKRIGMMAAAIGAASGAMLAPSFALAQTATDPATVVDDVIVTATKRPEASRTIAASLSAFDEHALELVGAQDMAGYLTRTPGVVFNQTIPGNSAAILRGVATTTGIAQAQGTTGYFINDVPLTDPFYSGGIPDIDTFDVDNIAVLRGPQGTLFGSASLGGAINYQARRPDLDTFEARVRGSVEDTEHGSEGYAGQAMVNVPLIDGVLAVRGVLLQRREAGFIDNLGTGQANANRTDVSGGRFLATFAPFDGTRVNYLFLRQDTDTRDAGSAEESLGDYAKSTAIAEPFSFRTILHNLRVDQELGFATLTATATHHAKTFTGLQDYSGLAPAFAPVGFLEPGKTKGDTFEVRLASPSGQPLEYLVGVFYDRTEERVTDQLIAPSAAGLFGSATLLDATVRIIGRESAAFGEASYRFGQVKATVGGRVFKTELFSETLQTGPLVGPGSHTFGRSEETGFSPKASLTWNPAADQMIYALVSKGFRFGGPNIATDPSFAIPSQFDSDSLVNYELGVRSNLFDRRLQLDGTLFYVDWDDIQVSQRSPSGFIYTANAGKARNQGVEASATVRPIANLTLQGSVTYLDAELRRDFGAVPKGSRLPGASKWQVSDSIAYTVADAPFQPSLVLSHRYISSAPGELTPAPEMQGGYNLFDLRLSAVFGPAEVTAFVENIGDARGVSQASTSVRGPVQFLVRPRTFGVAVDYRFP